MREKQRFDYMAGYSLIIYYQDFTGYSEEKVKNLDLFIDKQKELTAFYKYTNKKFPGYLKNRITKKEATEYFKSLDDNIFDTYINYLATLYKEKPSYKKYSQIYDVIWMFNEIFFRDLKFDDREELLELLFMSLKKQANKIVKYDTNSSNFLYALMLFMALDETLAFNQKDLTHVLDLINHDSLKKLCFIFDRLPIGHPAIQPWQDFLGLNKSERSDVLSLSRSCLKNYINRKLAL